MDTQVTDIKCGIPVPIRCTRVGIWCSYKECILRDLMVPLSREIRALPKLEGVESSEEAETEDDLEAEELVEEAKRVENVEKETANVDCQSTDNFGETVEEETVEE